MAEKGQKPSKKSKEDKVKPRGGSGVNKSLRKNKGYSIFYADRPDADNTFFPQLPPQMNTRAPKHFQRAAMDRFDNSSQFLR